MFSFINETVISDIDYSFLNTLPDKAIILLKSKNRIKKAEEILNYLLDQQITATASEHYGLWLMEDLDSEKTQKFSKKI